MKWQDDDIVYVVLNACYVFVALSLAWLAMRWAGIV